MNISDFALICDIEPAEPEMNTIIHENTSTTAVRMAVATSESVLRMPHLARIAVRAAKTAENTAAVSHINKTSFYEFSHPAEIVPAGFGVYAALAAEFLLVHSSYSSAAEYRVRNVDYHRAEAGEAPYLLERFDKLVLVFVFKAVLAFCGEYDIRYHNDDDENKAVEIEPFHLF